MTQEDFVAEDFKAEYQQLVRETERVQSTLREAGARW